MVIQKKGPVIIQKKGSVVIQGISDNTEETSDNTELNA